MLEQISSEVAKRFSSWTSQTHWFEATYSIQRHPPGIKTTGAYRSYNKLRFKMLRARILADFQWFAKLFGGYALLGSTGLLYWIDDPF